MKGGIFGNLEGSSRCAPALKIFHSNHVQEDVKSFTFKKGKRSVKLRQGRIIKGVENVGNCCWNLYARKNHKGTPFYVSARGFLEGLQFNLQSWRQTQCI